MAVAVARRGWLVACALALVVGCDADATAPGDAPRQAPERELGSARSNETAAPAPAAAARVPTIVFLGDSLTAGFGLIEKEALPALIQSRIDTAHLSYHVVNAGRSGDTTAGGLARIDWYLKESIDLRALVIGLGSNDAMRGLPLASMEENLRGIIRRTRERKPEAQIFLWELKTFPNLGARYAGDYAAVFPRLAESEKVALIPFPLEPVAARPELNQSDGIHPTAEGTALVAERVWSSLRPHL